MKRIRPPARRPAKRNPLARALRDGIYAKPRVVERADRYRRRPKHRKLALPPEEEA